MSNRTALPASAARAIAFAVLALLAAHSPRARAASTAMGTPPVITSQPQPAVSCLWNPAWFSVAATGGAPLSYQWRRGGTPIPGATGPQLQLQIVDLSYFTTYDVVVSNPFGSVTSNTVALDPDPRDEDGDGATNCNDACLGDPNKISPGICGCGVPDTDSDGDGLADCIDNCAAIANPGQADCDLDYVGDACEIAAGSSLDANGNGVPDECEPAPFVPYCLGDGSGAACPCANHVAAGTLAGCLHSLGAGGTLVLVGVPSVGSDTLALSGSHMPNSLAIFLQGSTQLNGGLGATFGDGLRCVGGSIVRLGSAAISQGSARYPTAGAAPVSVQGLVVPGAVRTYQVWFRNADSFCTSATFNLTNGCLITWGA